MSVIASICARGGSKGLPGKNTRMLDGKPLIVHTIDQALSCGQIDKVFVSTDCSEIANIAENAGATVPFLRPAELATDRAPKVPVIEHLVDHVTRDGCNVTLVVDLDPTSPLRTVEDIDTCIELIDDQTDLVVTAFESDKNPYFNMVELKQDGRIGLVSSPSEPILSRQSAPKVYSLNASIYVWRPAALTKGLWGGKLKLHVMPRCRSIDIDSELDFRLVELLMDRRDA
jgi:CMP-N,N'-diacetyllegionaminic acid synthase